MLQPAHEISSIEQKQPVLLTSSNQSSMYAQGWKLPTMESSPLMSTLSVNVETTPTTVVVNKSSSAKEMTVEDLKQQENNAGVMEGGEDENGGEKRVFISLAELKAHSLTEEGTSIYTYSLTHSLDKCTYKHAHIHLDVEALSTRDCCYSHIQKFVSHCLCISLQRDVRSMCSTITLWVSLPCAFILKTSQSSQQRKIYTIFLGDTSTGHLKMTRTCVSFSIWQLSI